MIRCLRIESNSLTCKLHRLRDDFAAFVIRPQTDETILSQLSEPSEDSPELAIDRFPGMLQVVFDVAHRSSGVINVDLILHLEEGTTVDYTPIPVCPFSKRNKGLPVTGLMPDLAVPAEGQAHVHVLVHLHVFGGTLAVESCQAPRRRL